MEILKRAYVQFYRDKWRENLIKREYHDAILKAIKVRDIENAIEYLKKELMDF